jgi:hypothetical protein
MTAQYTGEFAGLEAKLMYIKHHHDGNRAKIAHVYNHNLLLLHSCLVLTVGAHLRIRSQGLGRDY